MTVYRIGEMAASEGHIADLHHFLLSIIPLIRSSEGCQGVELYQSQDDPARFIMVEIWDSAEMHQASVTNIPADLIAQIRPLLAGSPDGAYFGLVSRQ